MNAQALQEAVVEVRYADPPREGKKQATIKTAAGDVYGMAPAMLGLFRKGCRYRIEYTTRDFKGRHYHTIVKSEPVATAAEPANQRAAAAPGSPSEAEVDFVSRCLAASIASCAVGRSREELTERARMLRQVYRDAFGS